MPESTQQTPKIQVNRRVRQGGTISPKLFTLALEEIFKKMNWQQTGLKIDRLRLADDIVLISKDPEELKEMIQQLNEASISIRLKMNINKTKILSPTYIQLTLSSEAIENVEEYIYLGHAIKLGKDNQKLATARRIGIIWAAFGRLKHILKNPEIPINLNRKVYDTCILHVVTYGLETTNHKTQRKQSENSAEGV